ncbi:MAG: hypothetical protein K1X54_02680 [Flavobacteriales bacterium]|nr:hypothetical protein [Flavobacteriales bacterium]
MKKYLFRFIIFCCSLSLASCTREPSASVDQDKIYTKYELIYDANTDMTTVKAEFRFGSMLGTKLELSHPASVSFNGELIPFNSTLAIYEEQIAGFISSGIFSYTDVEGHVYENQTGRIKTISFPGGSMAIDRGTDHVMPFIGNPVGSEDVVSLKFANKVFSTSIVGSSSITIGGVQTNGIEAGAYTASMSRTHTDVLHNATPEGGSILLTYKAHNKAIQVN